MSRRSPKAFATRSMFVVAGLMLLGGCGGGSLSCSSSEAKSLALQIVKESWDSNLGMAALYLMDQTKLSLENVRTVSQTDLRMRCAADLRAFLVARPGPNGQTVANTGEGMTPVSYSVQLTDEKRLYVTIDSMN